MGYYKITKWFYVPKMLKHFFALKKLTYISFFWAWKSQIHQEIFNVVGYNKFAMQIYNKITKWFYVQKIFQIFLYVQKMLKHFFALKKLAYISFFWAWKPLVFNVTNFDL